MKKAKRYDGEDGSVVTDTAQGQNKSISDDVRARAMAAMAARDQDVGGGGKTGSTPTPKAAPKASPKAETKSEAPAKKSAVQEAKDVVSGKGASMPKSFSESGGSSKATRSSGNLSGLGFKMPSDPLARYDNKNWSMKSGGKVGSASKRADGIAQRGKTRGKTC